jgi:antitoxin Phd
MRTWQLQEAKAKLSKVLDIAEQDGPQMITRRGLEAAVIVPIDEWKRLNDPKTQTMLELLQSGPVFEVSIPSRGRLKMRKPVAL